MTDSRRFKRSDIEKQKTKGEVVFIIDNRVYDVTKFLEEHPGGHEVLVDAAGADASGPFGDVGHSADAKQLMNKYVVGELVDEDKTVNDKRKVNWNVPSSNETGESFLTSWKFSLAVAVVLTAIHVYIFGL